MHESAIDIGPTFHDSDSLLPIAKQTAYDVTTPSILEFLLDHETLTAELFIEVTFGGATKAGAEVAETKNVFEHLSI